MGKRFGRNQRRKLHERVAQLETAFRMEGAMKDRIRQERDQLSSTLTTVERVLGPYFAGLPPKTMRVAQSFKHQPVVNLVNLANQTRPDRSFLDPSVPLPLLMRCERMEAWLLDSYMHFDAARSCVHVVLSYQGLDNPRAAYMLSETALASMDWRDLEQHVAPMLARTLKEGLTSHGARG